YVDGQSLTIVPRFGAGKEALASRAVELVGLKPDAILAAGDDPARAARDATDAIPIVMADSSDPVGDGLIAGLARPGGNVTGLTSLATLLRAKRLELLRAVAPGVSSVAVLWVSNTDESPNLHELQAAAEALGVQLSVVTARGAGNLASPFADASLGRVDGLIVLAGTSTRSTQAYQRQIADFATERRLPAVYESRTFAEAGGLMAYGPNIPDLFRRAAAYVDKILKGTKPADLPV